MREHSEAAPLRRWERSSAKLPAAARDMLTGLAAEAVERGRGTAGRGRWKNFRTDRRPFDELRRARARAALRQMLPAEDPVMPAAEWTIAGKPLPKVAPRFRDRAAQVPVGYEAVRACCTEKSAARAFNATLVSVDTSAAKAMPGVTVVHDGDFIGVAAAG